MPSNPILSKKDFLRLGIQFSASMLEVLNSITSIDEDKFPQVLYFFHLHFKDFVTFKLVSHFCVYHVLTHTHGGQRTVWESQSFPSTMWVPGTKFRASGLAASAST